MSVEMSDGVQIEGWIGMPRLPKGVRAPVIMNSSPYFYGCYLSPLAGGPYCSGGPGDAGYWTDPPSSGPPGFEFDEAVINLGIAPIRFVREGFAVAFFAVRGTANSGGCNVPGGRRERADQSELVTWLGRQSWSNGRVGTAGISYSAMTATQAAVAAPPSLKTIVITGLVMDWYTQMATPQGALTSIYPVATGPFYAEISLYPDPFHIDRLQNRIEPESQRACPELIESLAHDTTIQIQDDRDAAFFAERRLIEDLERVTASSLILHGFGDARVPWEEDVVWHALRRSSKHLILGQWGHQWPTPAHAALLGIEIDHPSYWKHDMEELLIRWYDYWLKGAGDRPKGLGSADYQDRTGRWHRSRAWPPAETVDEALYLSGDALRAVGSAGRRSYSTRPNPLDIARAGSADPEEAAAPSVPDYGVFGALCPSADVGTSGVVYRSRTVVDPVLVAGNPYAWLKITSDEPAGLLDVRLVDIGPDFSCDDYGRPSGYQELASGVADLRFHAGNFVGKDFPTDSPRRVRVDMSNLAHRIQRGHRLALVAGTGETGTRYNASPPGIYPTITVISGTTALASHIVLPVVGGTLGGGPSPEIPASRPFVP